MIAIRQFQQITSDTITIRLPVDFPAKQVEIIILPVDESKHEISDLQNLLLSAPTLSEEELQEYNAVRTWMNQWDLNDF